MHLQQLFLYATAAYVIWNLYSRLQLYLKHRRFKAHPIKRARFGNSSLPFGLDFVKETYGLRTTFRNFEVFRERAKVYGNTYGTSILGQRLYITSDPENIKAVLATQFGDYGKGPIYRKQWRPFLGDSIFTTDGQAWQHARALLRPTFLKERITDLDNFEDKMQIMLPLIKSGAETDMMDLMFRYTLDVSTEFLFGQSAGSLQGDNAFAKTFADVQEIQTHRSRAGPLWRFVGIKAFNVAIRNLNKYVDRYVQYALAKPSGDEADPDDHSLLAALVQESRDPVYLRYQLIANLLAGRDTTATVLSWALRELSHTPDIYDRLREEVLQIVGESDTRPTYAQLKKMKLLQAVINETMRLYPLVPFNLREALQDTTLPRGGGVDGMQPVFVPAGMQIGYSTLLLHRQTKIPRVNEFFPHRWIDGIDEEGKYVPDFWTFIPFNGGPRVCIGQGLALIEIAYTLTRLIQRFSKLENLDEPYPDLGLRFDVLLTPRYGVKVRFTE